MYIAAHFVLHNIFSITGAGCNNLHSKFAIDNAFVRCAMLHNMMLKADGYLDNDLPAFSEGVEERLAKNLESFRWSSYYYC